MRETFTSTVQVVSPIFRIHDDTQLTHTEQPLSTQHISNRNTFISLHPPAKVIIFLTSCITTSNIIWEQMTHAHILLLTNLWKPGFWSFVATDQMIQSLPPNFLSLPLFVLHVLLQLTTPTQYFFIPSSCYLEVSLQMLGHWFWTSLLS
jgi:hypothetical protein